jgi:hypothetical protein
MALAKPDQLGLNNEVSLNSSDVADAIASTSKLNNNVNNLNNSEEDTTCPCDKNFKHDSKLPVVNYFENENRKNSKRTYPEQEEVKEEESKSATKKIHNNNNNQNDYKSTYSQSFLSDGTSDGPVSNEETKIENQNSCDENSISITKNEEIECSNEIQNVQINQVLVTQFKIKLKNLLKFKNYFNMIILNSRIILSMIIK